MQELTVESMQSFARQRHFGFPQPHPGVGGNGVQGDPVELPPGIARLQSFPAADVIKGQEFSLMIGSFRLLFFEQKVSKLTGVKKAARMAEEFHDEKESMAK